MHEVVIIVKSIALPPFSLFFLALVGWLVMRQRRRLGRIILCVSLTLLYAISTPYVGTSLLRTLQQTEPLALTQPTDQAAAIVVLAAGVRQDAPEYGGDTIDALTLERLRYAAKLHRELGLPILVTGGATEADIEPVAVAMRESLERDFGVPTGWLETDSRSTDENAVFSARILQDEGIKDVYLVSHAWHMPRAALAFEAAGLRVMPAPTGFLSARTPELTAFVASAKGLLLSYYALHEMVGYLWYQSYYVS